MREFTVASGKKDVAAMEAALAKVKELDKSGRYVSSMELEISIVKKDWDTVGKALAQDEVNPAVVMRVIRLAAAEEDLPLPLVETATAKFVALAGDKAGAMEFQIISRLQWKLDKKADALASARAALEKAKEAKATRPGFPIEPFEKFTAAVEEGKMPTDAEFRGWLQEAMPNRAAP
jgi:hypothetical protein